MKKKITPFVSGLFLAATSSLALAVEDAATDKTESPLDYVERSYIVTLKDKHKTVLEYDGGLTGLEATKPNTGEKINVNSIGVKKYLSHLDEVHENILENVGVDGKKKIYSYKYALNGFSARLTDKQVEILKSSEDVAGVFEDKLLKPQTNTSHKYLGLSGHGKIWERRWTGEDIVVGIIDSGINPEHPSFADVKTHLNGFKGSLVSYSDAPKTFKGEGCEFGNTDFNPEDADFSCNNKLLTAQYFAEAFLRSDELVPTEFLSARDSDGHGSHTASTAAGNYGVPAEVDGKYEGEISGVAPRARIAAYKVCWEGKTDGGCRTADSMAAIDQAIADGVDVINFSIGGASTYFGSPSAIAFLRAMNAGIFVATSQGNSGPDAATTGTPAGIPWITSVGASQDDGVFATGIDVLAPSEIAGESIGLEGSGKITLEDTGDIVEEVVPASPLEACSSLTNKEELENKIALVKRGTCSFADKYKFAEEAGALAIVVYNDGTSPSRINPITMGGLSGDETIPGIMIGFETGDAIETTYLETGSISAKIGPSISISRDNRIATFSSRGPNLGATDIIKPDVVAPGVDILAAGSAQPNEKATSSNFVSLNGTSMSSPHVAGLFALLKQVHPDWTPAMARSALMTSARTNLKKDFGEEAATPFDIGAGHVVPKKAFSPGLVYDAGLKDYLAFTCENNATLASKSTCDQLKLEGYSFDGSDLNLPSIGIGELTGRQTITRTVTSTAPGYRRFTSKVNAPEGVDVVVSPRTMRLRKGESASYTVSFEVNDDATFEEWSFGDLSWQLPGHRNAIRSPIAIRAQELSAPLSIAGEGTSSSIDYEVSFGYQGVFDTDISGMVKGDTSKGIIEDFAINQSDAFIIPPGTKLARFSLFDEEVGAANGAEDIDIQVYGPASQGFPFVGESIGVTSNETVDIENPAAGLYVVVVFDISTEAGDSPYTIYNFNVGADESNATISSTDSATFGENGSITLEWDELDPESRYMGVINYKNDSKVFSVSTKVMIDTH